MATTPRTKRKQPTKKQLVSTKPKTTQKAATPKVKTVGKPITKKQVAATKPKAPKKTTTAKTKTVTSKRAKAKKTASKPRVTKKPTVAKTKTGKKPAVSKTNRVTKLQAVKKPAYSRNAWAGVAMAAAIIAPQLSLLWQPKLGVYVTEASLLGLFYIALSVEHVRRLAIVAAILPVALLVSLSLPGLDTFSRTNAYYSVILALMILCSFTFRLDEPLGIKILGKKLLLLIPLMIVIGEVMSSLGFSMLRHTYAFHGTPLPIVAGAVITFAIAEEFLFRGLIQRQASKVFHPFVAVALTIVAYGVVFIGHGSILPALFAVIAGTTLSLIYYFKQNLILTITTNVVMKLGYLGLLASFVLR